MSLRFLSVCSGIEAASVAWQPLGWKAVAFSEIEPFPSAVLAHHYPDTPNWGDMTRFKEWPDATFDLLCGGTPCQSFSVAGLRAGLADPRGNLMLTFGSIAQRYRPRWLVWENVPGVLSSNGGRDFGAFLGMLGQIGYGFAYRVLDAQYFGVAQRRRRVFVVGCLGDWRRAAAVLFERHSLSGHPAPGRQSRQNVTGTLGARATAGGGLGTDFDLGGGLIASNAEGSTGLPFLTASNLGKTVNNQTPLIAHTLRGEGFDASEDGTGRGTPLIALPACMSATQHAATEDVSTSLGSLNQTAVCALTLTKQSPTGGGQVQSVSYAFQPRIARNGRGDMGDVVSALNAQSGETGKGDAAPCVAISFQERGRSDGRSLEIGGDTAYALTAPNGGSRSHERNVLTPDACVRRLTPVECERLQGFPDDYTRIPWRGKPAEDCPDGPRYRALGNSWATNVASWIGRRIDAVTAAAGRSERMAA